MSPPSKRMKLLSDDEDSDESSQHENSFKINAEYAKRFEHNSKREEQHRLEEKYGKSFGSKRARGEDEEEEEDDESSTSEEEDDDAELATMDVDAEIMDTLQAIKNKDPRLYDKNVKFYTEFDPEAKPTTKKEKPMYLQDYHRQNLMAGATFADDDAEEPVMTHQQEQDLIRQQLVPSMHAGAGSDDEESDEDDLVVKASHQRIESVPATKTRQKRQITTEDIAAAEKDPETYLSNFMNARAWLPTDKSSNFAPMDSDDSDDDEKAEAFEEAYNMRFEDPQLANERLLTFSRDVGKYGVRREEATGRKKARDREREKKEMEKQERKEEKARLRKLRIEEAEEKVAKIKEAAGLTGQDVDVLQWREIIDGDFDDDQWDVEMQRRFGDTYYADREGEKVKKPKWDDDIDINDLVPDFDQGEDAIALSDDEDDGGAPLPPEDLEGEEEEVLPSKKKNSKKDREKAKTEAKKAARKQRLQIESIVDESLSMTPGPAKKGPIIGFRYRATSPTSFGLTTRDILYADDKQLNEFAGLKKLAAFRDEEKKRRDRKHLSKKARIRQWRKDTFGDADGPRERPERSSSQLVNPDEGVVDGQDGEQKKKKKRRSKKAKIEGATS